MGSSAGAAPVSDSWSVTGLLDGKSTIVTGAGKGIARACALEFARQGALITICDIDEGTGTDAAREIAQLGAPVQFVRADVSSSADCNAVTEAAVARYGRVDCLFNCAGIAGNGSVVECSEDEWNRVLAVNLTGMFLMSKHVVPHMRSRGRGSILNMASVSAYWGEPGTVAYNASKGGVLALTRAMAQDHGPEGIRVNCLAPGFHDTGMVDDYFDAQPDGAEARTRINQLMAVRRIGRPEELARTAAFTLSDANGYMTAATIVLDGAMSVGYTWAVE
jgi:NAD(P)-dependent dehydrogenase (short-subunit alcohol dehydrogenase family)